VDAVKMYRELAGWWPLLSAPEEYAEEAAFYRRALIDAAELEIGTVLELGSGGGNNASHLKRWFELTLVELAPAMLAVSRGLNPECEHVHGDMRTVRLGREFDAVFVHDAVCYMTSEADLRRAMETAFIHTRPGGAALFAPDHVRETFQTGTDHGGADGDGRALRYLEWTWDPDAADDSYTVDYVLVMRDREDAVRVEHDRHVEGLFPRAVWLRSLAAVGYRPAALLFQHSDVERPLDVFVGTRPR
jgi:SAM-dependent methyltransferase